MTDAAASVSAPTRCDFYCSICMDLLYKPCVSPACSHVYCFWCFHKSMDFLNTTHACPLCRADFVHFPSVCVPLHRYLVSTFPEEMAAREEETADLERKEYHAESPVIGKGEGSNVMQEFNCVECGNLAAPPTVLSCGHIVCCGTATEAASRRKKRKCPVEGCVGKVAARGDSPAVCSLIDRIIHATLSSSQYEAVASLSEQCPGLNIDEEEKEKTTKHADDNDKAKKGELSPGDVVVLGGLTSAKGSQLNGSRAKVQSYCASSSRYIIRLVSPPPGMQPVFNARRENLQKVENPDRDDNYVHYGVGCDSCGAFPVRGRRYKCKDCSEEIGFDLCGECFDAGVHKRTGGGRFNQMHQPNHEMEEMEQDTTILHLIQQANPDVPLPQLLQMLGMELGSSEEAAAPGDSEHT